MTLAALPPISVLLVALLCGCGGVGAQVYVLGEWAEISFEDPGDAELAFACRDLSLEALVDAEWIDTGPVPCSQLAPLLPATPDELLHALVEPGIWRIRVDADAPCGETGEARCKDAAYSPPVPVRDPPDAIANPGDVECFVGGCNAELCADEPLFGVCVSYPWHVCFDDAVCGRFAEAGSCGWAPTPELVECLAGFGMRLRPNQRGAEESN